MRYVRMTENLLVSAVLICLIALFAVHERVQEWMRRRHFTASDASVYNRAN